MAHFKLQSGTLNVMAIGLQTAVTFWEQMFMSLACVWTLQAAYRDWKGGPRTMSKFKFLKFVRTHIFVSKAIKVNTDYISVYII